MTDPEASEPSAAAANPGAAADSDTPESRSAPMTSAQAEQILAELKAVKRNLLWLLVLAGFFAARAFFFHY